MGKVSHQCEHEVWLSMGKRCWVLLFFVFVSGCSMVPTANYDDSRHSDGGGRKFVIWMLSDIQPPTRAERGQFERAIDDVNNHIDQADLAVVAGDLLKSRSQDDDFSWFVETRSRSKVLSWYEIAGNHDVRSGQRFWQYFPHPSYYAVEVGNILLLLMSDESAASKTELSDETFEWWRDMVVNNQDRIIITVTHAQLAGSGLLSSSIASRRIDGSKPFEKVLQEQRVAIWASGHSHLPQGLAGTVSIQEKLGGTCFVNVSSIDEGAILDSQSRFFVFEEGSDRVWIRSRNHTQGRFDKDLDIELHTGKSFVWNGARPEVLASFLKFGSGQFNVLSQRPVSP